MARISTPVDSKKKQKQRGADGQLHGGMMETVDQVSNALTQAVGNIGKGTPKEKK